MTVLKYAASVVIALLATVPIADAAARPVIPDDFPKFIVPGHDGEMAILRELYYLHYQSGGPLATLWDEWLSSPTLWPAVTTGGRMDSLRKSWAATLSGRIMDAEGYVATHQHGSIAHQHGWPFPFWGQGGPGTWGWHFALPNVPPGFHNTQEKTQEGWELTGGEDKKIADGTWNIALTAPRAAVRTPALLIEPFQSPFIQLRWRTTGLEDAQPYLEWTTEAEPKWSPDRRFYFPPATAAQGVIYTMIPVFQSPAWKGRITRLGINFDNAAAATAGIQALFTQYDTRHTINNQNFLRGCCNYFWWTRDLNFLRDNLARMRTALLYSMTVLGGRSEKCIVAPYVGHDGRSGFDVAPDGKKTFHSGRGIGHNYWDILPMGHKDAYGTIHYYDALLAMARLEEEIAAHPEWDLPGGALRQDPDALRQHAGEVKAHAGRLFWNAETGRFTCGIDADGKAHDYGFTFINCEAIHYGFATDQQADSIVRWLSGDRVVTGDTSQGKDIYHYRFAPRATTRRNIEHYGWFWSGPETIPWGGQVQDGGAVLGFSYHDMMSRLKVRGPDNARDRLNEIVQWFEEVQKAGGYREYYKDGKIGMLQGGGTAGALGLDAEFFESILAPQIMIDGFLGFRPRADGFELNPRLPKDWPELTITRIHLHRITLYVTASTSTITLATQGQSPWPLRAYPPAGKWRVQVLTPDGKVIEESSMTLKPGDGVPLHIADGHKTKLSRE